MIDLQCQMAFFEGLRPLNKSLPPINRMILHFWLIRRTRLCTSLTVAPDIASHIQSMGIKIKCELRCWGKMLGGQVKGIRVFVARDSSWPGHWSSEIDAGWLTYLGTWLAMKIAAELCCWLVAAVWESWCARKKRIRLENATYRWLLLQGILVNQEHFCRTLLLVGSCWDWLTRKKLGCVMPRVVRWRCCWWILVIQENGCRALLVGSCWWGILVCQEKN